jgi:carbonic anhydrase/acetyltransferase-like protein (isoleucine patch superfamily)
VIYTLGDRTPVIHGEYFLAPGAQVVGEVEIGHCVSFWYNSVVRADGDKVTIGDYSNLQECAVIHVDPGVPVTIGYGVIIGHKAMIHSCTIGDRSLIGMNAVILNNARIGKYCLIGANTLIPENMEIPDGSLVVGSPGKVVRQLKESEIEMLAGGGEHYWQEALLHKDKLTPFIE